MITAWLGELGAWGLTGLGVMFLLEGFGVPFPPEIPLILAGGLAHAGQHPFWVLVLVAWSFTVAGNLVGYALGYVGGRPLAERVMNWAGISPERLARVEGWIHRHGLKLIFCFRWINWGFPMSLWLAGVGRMPWTRLVPWMLVLNLVWAIIWIWLGGLIAMYLDLVGAVDLLLVVAAAILLLSLVLWWRNRRPA